MFGALDYIYVPAADVDAEAQRYAETLGAELAWKVAPWGPPWPACGWPGRAAILLSGHLKGPGAILVYRVEDYAATVRRLRERGVTVHELEIRTGRAPRSRWRQGSGTRCTS